MLTSHLESLKKLYPIVLPGDPLDSGWSLCLTFDDASYDFYHYVFPLLVRLKIKVLLGVPAHYILADTTLSAEERLSVPYPLHMQEGWFEKKAPFCTWKELREMVSSGYVEIASHSYLHPNMTFSFVDLHREIILSKQVIEKEIQQKVHSFIYPFGRVNGCVHKKVMEHYSFAFRIGSASNRSWECRKNPLKRVPADGLSSPTDIVSLKNRLKYRLKSIFA